jgi:ribosomal protein S2
VNPFEILEHKSLTSMKNHINYIITTPWKITLPVYYSFSQRKVRQIQVQMEAVPESSSTAARIAKKLLPEPERTYDASLPPSVVQRRIETYHICRALVESGGWLGSLRGLQHPMMYPAVLQYMKSSSVVANARAIIQVDRSARIFSNALHYIRKNIRDGRLAPEEVIFVDTREFTSKDPVEAKKFPPLKTDAWWRYRRAQYTKPKHPTTSTDFLQTGRSTDILIPEYSSVEVKEEFNTRIRRAATSCGAYYVDSRWLPGIITNRKQTSGSVRRLRLLDKNLRVAPRKPFANFSRKVASKFTREFSRLRRIFAGIQPMQLKHQKPSLVVFFSLHSSRAALKECTRQGIKTIAFLNTDEDPTNITFPITVNTSSLQTHQVALDLIADTLKPNSGE